MTGIKLGNHRLYLRMELLRVLKRIEQEFMKKG